MNTVKKIFGILSIRERRQFSILMSLTLVMALLDAIGVASIMPFIALLANPNLLTTNRFLSAAYVEFGFKSQQIYLFALGVTVFVVFVLSLAYKALVVYLQIRFARMREYTIGGSLVQIYLFQPYSWFLNRNSADLAKNVLSEVGTFVSGGLIPLMTLVSQSALTFAILCLLLFIDLQLAITVIVFLITCYGVIFSSIKECLKNIGQARVKANRQRFTAVSESFGAVKEVKVAGLEGFFAHRFEKPAETYARGQVTSHVISQLPKFVIEAITFGGILVLILYLIEKRGDFASALPIISLYTFAGYRLMPAIQQVYVSITQLRASGPAINALHADVTGLHVVDVPKAESDKVKLTNSLMLNRVGYTYPGASRPALKEITLVIPVNKVVAFVGPTGSGKTTVVDVITGLLVPQDGELNVDGENLTEFSRRQWQKSIGYVPQQIFVTDDSVASNISFGVQPDKVEQTKLERAAKIANLHDFVVNELPEGYETKLGERGVRLSGGQRQRIGIARALYHNPQILILDEATSALDNLTEKTVMEAINSLGGQITIIVVAHRLNTIKSCDLIFELDRGRIVASGSFSELLANSPSFRRMSMSLIEP